MDSKTSFMSKLSKTMLVVEFLVAISLTTQFSIDKIPFGILSMER